MNETTKPQHTYEIFSKRLAEPFPLFGGEDYKAALWLILLGAVLTLALVYIVFMYIKDSRRVGAWSLLLGLLRISVYAILAVLFLLPARRQITRTVENSKVLVLFDVTESMEKTRDDLPIEGQKVADLPTRQSKVLAFQADKKVVLDEKDGVKLDFFEALEKRNPVTAYRFHLELDKSFFQFTDERAWTNLQWADYQKNPREEAMPAKGPLSPEVWKAWLNPMGNNKRISEPGQLEKLNKTILGQIQVANGELMRPGQEMVYGTNLAGAVDALLDEEGGRMLQGVVVFTDGRSTRRSQETFDRVKEKAKQLRVPIFVVGVGAIRQKVQITTNPLGVPERIQPESPYQVIVQAVGVGLPLEEVDVTLEVRYVRKKKDGTFDRQWSDPPGKGGELDIILEEDKRPNLGGRLDDPQPGEKPMPEKPVDDKKSDKADRVSVGKLLTFKPKDPNTGKPYKPKFTKDSPPQLQVPFDLSARDFVEAADAKTKEELAKHRSWVLAPTEDDTELQYRAIIGRHPREVTDDAQHITKVAGMKVIKHPLRVLLFAGGSSQEFRFVSRLMTQEMEKGLAQVAFYTQKTLKRDERIIAHKQDPMRRRTLITFPTKYKKKGPDLPRADIDEKDGFGIEQDTTDGTNVVDVKTGEFELYDLDNYDVIVAFDADWGKLDEEQVRNVAEWLEGKKDKEKGAGGLIIVGGPINTTQLARPGAKKAMLQPLIDLLPVVPKDIDLVDNSRATTDLAWRLDFLEATRDLEFLHLAEGDEPGARGAFLADWQEVFGPSPNPDEKNQAERGIHSVYPIEMVRDTVAVPARFTDPRVALVNGKMQPFLAMWPTSDDKRVIWIGSGELWRLRTFSGPAGDGIGVKFYERFWAKLTRFAGSKRLTASGKKLAGMHFGVYTVGGTVTGVVDVVTPDGKPPTKDTIVKAILTLPPELSSNKDPKKPDPMDKANERVLTMRPMTRPGRFQIPFQLPRKGDYKLEFVSGDLRSEAMEFTAEAINPEEENTQPDFRDMWDLASESDLVLARLSNEAVKKRLTDGLQRPHLETVSQNTDDSRSRLYFTLANADLIPLCMITDTKPTVTQGAVQDLWDWGPPWPFAGSSWWSSFCHYVLLDKISYALILASLLLSVEWLIRKLLRLA